MPRCSLAMRLRVCRGLVVDARRIVTAQMVRRIRYRASWLLPEFAVALITGIVQFVTDPTGLIEGNLHEIGADADREHVGYLAGTEVAPELPVDTNLPFAASCHDDFLSRRQLC